MKMDNRAALMKKKLAHRKSWNVVVYISELTGF